MTDKGKGKQTDEYVQSSGSKSSQAHRRGASAGSVSASKQRDLQSNWRKSTPPAEYQLPSTPQRLAPPNWARPQASNSPISPSRASPTKSKRKSIAELFDIMDIKDPGRDSPRSSPRPTQATPRQAARFPTFSRLPGGFPNWSTFKRSDGGDSPLELLLKRAASTFGYERIFGGEGGDATKRCETAFIQATADIMAIRNAVGTGRQETEKTLEEALADSMGKVIFGSNAIERVGADERETMKLCREVLLDSRSYLESVPARSAEYYGRLEEAIKDEAARTQMKPDRARGRREVVNHAAALMEMTNVVIKEGQPFSEDLIKHCHKILCHEVDAHNSDGKPRSWTSYAGVYRSVDATDQVSAGNTSFVRPAMVARAMARFIQQLNEDLRKAELEKSLDPFLIAANACGDFVNIHPFFDGNGRTCRLILNTIVLKYVGIVCPIGEHADERRDYMEICKRRSDNEEGNGELAGMILKQAVPGLRTLRQRLEASRNK